MLAISALLAGATLSSFVDGPADRITPDGVTIVLATQTARVQANSDLTYGAGNPNRSIWQLYGHSPIGNLLPASAISTRGYAIVWLADDDGDPLVDSNQIVALRAHAFGERGTETEIEVTVAMGTNTTPPPASKTKVKPRSPPADPRQWRCGCSRGGKYADARERLIAGTQHT